jgi:hypothetical protein
MREAMMRRTMKPFDYRRRRELALIGAAICAMGIVTSNSVRAADLELAPPPYQGGYGGYQGQPYPYAYHPYPPQVQNYPLHEGPTIYYPQPPQYYRPHAWADPDVGYRYGDAGYGYGDVGYRYGRPNYYYSPYADRPYVDRPPAPIPFASDPRDLPPPDDMLAEQSPGYGWQPPPGPGW